MRASMVLSGFKLGSCSDSRILHCTLHIKKAPHKYGAFFEHDA